MIKFEKVSETTYYNFLKKSENAFITEDQLDSMIDYLKNGLSLPKRSTKNSAGYDFYLPKSIVINPGEKIKIGSGIKVCLDQDKVLLVMPRSSIGIKKNIIIANTIGVIDSDYYNNEDNEGHILFVLKNIGEESVPLERGERIAQGIITKFYTTDDDTSKETRIGGIGSTNVSNENNTNERLIEKAEEHQKKIEGINKHIDEIGKSKKWNGNNHYKK